MCGVHHEGRSLWPLTTAAETPAATRPQETSTPPIAKPSKAPKEEGLPEEKAVARAEEAPSQVDAGQGGPEGSGSLSFFGL